MVSSSGEPSTPLELFNESSADLPTVAISRAQALELPTDGSVSWLGTGLDLSVEPTARASERLVRATSGIIDVQAIASGVGVGTIESETNLFSGGGYVGGTASANATGVGNNEAQILAFAGNSGVLNTNYVSRTNEPLRFGTDPADPFQAVAEAGNLTLVPTSSTGSPPSVEMQAIAEVRGLQSTTNALNDRPIFQGQLDANVLGSATLNLDPAAETTALAWADSRGITNYQVAALTHGAPTSPALIRGAATVEVNLNGTPPPLQQSPIVIGTAIGIDSSKISTDPFRDTNVIGIGIAQFNNNFITPFGSLPTNTLGKLTGIGISGGTINTGWGNNLIAGIGAVTTNLDNSSLIQTDVAGIDKTAITALGNTRIYGSTPSEPLGFNGLRDVSITGVAGNTEVYGSATGTSITTLGANSVVNLDRVNALTFRGVADRRDIIMLGVSETNPSIALNNTVDTGFGDDYILVGNGGNNRLDASFGQDVTSSKGNESSDTFVNSNAGSALYAASEKAFAGQLADPTFWQSLDESEKQKLWDTGEYLDNGVLKKVDTTLGFDPGADGDTLELSSTLGSMTQEYWETDGAIFGVNDGKLTVTEGPPGSNMGIIVGTLQEIRSLVGVSGVSLAYATDTRQLMFDDDGDWRHGTQSIGQVSIADGEKLTRDNIRFNA